MTIKFLRIFAPALTWCLLLNLLTPLVVAQALDDGAVIQRLARSLQESDLIRFENAVTSEEKTQRQRWLAQFLSESTATTSDMTLQLLRVERDEVKGQSVEETNYNYLFTSHSGLRHLVIFGVAHFSDGSRKINLLSRPITNAMLTEGQFSLKGKTASQYTFLSLGILVMLFCLLMALHCWRMKPKGRWLWMIFILFGIFRVDMNWAANSMTITPFAATFLGFYVHKLAGFNPWIVTVSYPLGAAVFWRRRRAIINNAEAAHK